MNKKLVLISCYLGKLPWYFSYFLHSCRFNPSVDFLIIANDPSRPVDLPPNVKIISHGITDIVSLASQKLGFAVQIPNGYKLCDFKPAYGIIFSDFIAGYDFWGHCDIDIIFGNIREFITDDLLNRHDVISCRHDWLSGCFMLYRNDQFVNTLFTLSKDYRKVFTSERHYCFDETNFAHDAFSAAAPYDEIETEIESMTHVVKKLEAQGRLRPFFDFMIIEGLPGKLRWEKGRMYYRNKYEILFYHLIYFKTRFLPKKMEVAHPDHFYISPSRIYHDRRRRNNPAYQPILQNG